MISLTFTFKKKIEENVSREKNGRLTVINNDTADDQRARIV
jgi:hypothetical protein